MVDKIRIIFLSANPDDHTKLKVIEEYKRIDARMQESEFRDQFKLDQAHAVSLLELQGLLLRFKPNIVHFSGHGSEKGALMFEDSHGYSEEAPPKALSTLFRIINDDASASELQENRIRCVVLSACYSFKQAKAIAEHVDCVIGMSDAIKDTSATEFAASFYQALGYGKSIQTAFDLGRNQLALASDVDQSILKLDHKPSVSPNKIFLATQEMERETSKDAKEVQRRQENLLEHCNKIIAESKVADWYFELLQADMNKDYSDTVLEDVRPIYRYVIHLNEHLYTGQRKLYDLIVKVKESSEIWEKQYSDLKAKMRVELSRMLNGLGVSTNEYAIKSSGVIVKNPTLFGFDSLPVTTYRVAVQWPSFKFHLEDHGEWREDRWNVRVDVSVGGDDFTLYQMQNEKMASKVVDALNDYASNLVNQVKPISGNERRYEQLSDLFDKSFVEFFSNLKVGTVTLGGGCRYCLSPDFHSEKEIIRLRRELAKLHKNQ